MEVTGQLKAKEQTQKVSEKFQKRDFVITTESGTPYPQHITFQITQDKCALLDKYNVGDELTIHFNLKGREWNSEQGVKHFNTLEAWRIEKESTTTVAVKTTTTKPSGKVIQRQEAPVDDLPF